MAKPQLSSLLVLGVDLGTTAVWDANSSDVVTTARRLAQTFARYQLAATWALPMANVRTQTLAQMLAAIRDSTAGHEIGVRWEHPPIASQADVFRFHWTLRQELERFEQLGVRPTSLAADPRHPLPYVALSKTGVRTVRPTQVRVTQAVRCVQPQSMRYGVWGLPVSCFWPHSMRLFQGLLQHRCLHQTRVAVERKRAVHVVLDLPTLQRVDPELRGLDMLLRTVAQLSQQRGLRTARLCDVDRLLTARTIAQRPNRSILKRSA